MNRNKKLQAKKEKGKKTECVSVGIPQPATKLRNV